MRRIFLGKTKRFSSNREANFERRHLKAYLKGDKLFRFKYHSDRSPMYFEVKEAWITNEEYESKV